jgi:hypothetical protein
VRSSSDAQDPEDDPREESDSSSFDDGEEEDIEFRSEDEDDIVDNESSLERRSECLARNRTVLISSSIGKR